MDRDQLWYVYFKFYINQDDIDEGLKRYTTNIENMSPVGYNYKEYKVYTDNIGGLEHWVGDLGGYVSKTREIGFLDGAPSDAVYDMSFLMGSVRLTPPTLKYIHALKPPCGVLIRKISGSHAGLGLFKVVFSDDNILSHHFYYSIDESKIERYSYTEEITETQTGDFDVTIELDKNFEVPITVSTELSDTDKMFDRNFDTYAYLAGTNLSKAAIFDLGSIKKLFNVCFQYNIKDTTGTSHLYIERSVDNITWNEIEHIIVTSTDTGIVDYTPYRDLNVDARYIRVRMSSHVAMYNQLHELFIGCH